MGVDDVNEQPVKYGPDEAQDKENTDFLDSCEPFLCRKTQKEYPIVPLW